MVATGIDTPVSQSDLNATQARIADAAQRLRAQAGAQQNLDRAAAMRPPLAYATQASSPAPTQQNMAQHAHDAVDYGHDVDGVQLQSLQPKSSHYVDQPLEALAAAERRQQQPHPGPFIPPQAETPMRPVRLPAIEDLPMPAQTQIRAHRGEVGGEASPEVRRRTLLEKLASFGLSRHEDAQQAHASPRQEMEQGRDMGQQRDMGQRALPAAAGGATHASPPRRRRAMSEYARRAPPRTQRAQGQLDPLGRAPTPRMDDDQLEIPAFPAPSVQLTPT